MKHEKIVTGDLSYSPCRYGSSRMLFRGPRKRLDLPYLAFIGGTETYGKFIEKPFPSLVEKAMRQTCVNFGCVNGGIDAFVNDPTVMDICSEADSDAADHSYLPPKVFALPWHDDVSHIMHMLPCSAYF